MDILVLIARILFALLFILSGAGHIMGRKAMAGYAESRGIPAPEPAVIASGALILVGGILLLLGLWGDLGALFVLAFLLSAAFLMHAFWKESDPQARQMEMVQFNKDIGLAGAAIAFFVLFAYAGSDLGLTLTDPLFSIGH